MVLARVMVLAPVMVLAHIMVLACVMMLALKGAKDEVKRPEGHPTRSQGPEGP